MKRKLLFSCEKRRADLLYCYLQTSPTPWQGTQRIGFVLRLQPPPLPVSLWLIWRICEWSQSQWGLSPLHCCICLPVNVRHSGKHQMKTSQQVMWDLGWFKYEKKKEYIFILAAPHCSVVTALHLQQQACVRHRMTLLCRTWKETRRFEFITRQHSSHMCHLTSDAPPEHMEVLTEPSPCHAQAVLRKWRPESTY